MGKHSAIGTTHTMADFCIFHGFPDTRPLADGATGSVGATGAASAAGTSEIPVLSDDMAASQKVLVVSCDDRNDLGIYLERHESRAWTSVGIQGVPSVARVIAGVR